MRSVRYPSRETAAPPYIRILASVTRLITEWVSAPERLAVLAAGVLLPCEDPSRAVVVISAPHVDGIGATAEEPRSNRVEVRGVPGVDAKLRPDATLEVTDPDGRHWSTAPPRAGPLLV